MAKLASGQPSLGARVIVGVQVTNRGSDQGLTTPMLDEVERRSGQRPAELLVDGGYNAHEAIDHALNLRRDLPAVLLIHELTTETR